MNIVQDKVVMFERKSIEPRRNDLLYVWDLSSNRVQKIGEFDDLWMWHVEPDENLLVTFEIRWNTRPVETQQINWTLTGQLLDRKPFGRTDCLSGWNRRHMGPLGYPRILTHDHKTVTYVVEPRSRNTLVLRYDHTVERLDMKFSNAQGLFPPHGPTLFFTKDNCVFPTSELFYHLHKSYNDDHEVLFIINTSVFDINDVKHELKARERKGRKLLIDIERCPTSGEHISMHKLQLFADREVLSLAGDDGIELWFFNPNFVPDIPGAVPARYAAMDGSWKRSYFIYRTKRLLRKLACINYE